MDVEIGAIKTDIGSSSSIRRGRMGDVQGSCLCFIGKLTVIVGTFAKLCFL